MLGLLSLANELIGKISDQLDTRKAFRGTCKRINAIVSPRVFSYIIIDIHEERIDTGISQLEALATKSTCAAEHVRTVDIRRLAPNYNTSAYESGYAYINGKPMVTTSETAEGPKVDWALEKMHELLPKALSTLTGAKTVAWGMCNRNPEWASILVSEFLGTLPALSTLHLVAALGHSGLHPNRISNLTKLTVRRCPDAPIAEIIANSPHLTHLDLLATSYEVTKNTETLHSLLEKVPHGRPLRLRHLSISGYCVRLDHKTLPHFRHLRSLEVRFNPHIPADERQDYTEDLLSKSDRFGSSSSVLWRAIGRDEIPLEVVVAPASDAVVDYLASATGIKKISFSHTGTDVFADKFFTQVLPRYSKTLVSLSISASFEGRWCFMEHNIEILLECTRLAELTIAVDASTPGANGEGATMFDIVNKIMSMAAQMPNLWRLELLSANPERSRRARCGSLMVSHYWSTTRGLCESIASFGPVDPSVHPSLVSVPWNKWQPRRGADGNKFRPRRGADGVVKYVNELYVL